MDALALPSWATSGAAVARKLADAEGLVWLDAEGASGPQARWSFVAAAPVEVCRVAWGEPDVHGVASRCEHGRVSGAAADVLLCGGRLRAGDVPRWMGYVGYDAAWSAHPRRTPRLPRDPRMPVAWMGRYDALVAIDHARGESWLLSENEAQARALRACLDAPSGGEADALHTRVTEVSVPPREAHAEAIARAIEEIFAGEIYQVNLARRWTARLDGPLLGLFLAMRRASAVPFGFFLDAGDHAVSVRTMERFLEWNRGIGAVRTRPIKGTVPRSGTRDAEDADGLVRDEKERAEHVMIVDLMRNDLGRIAETGTVTVPELFVVEPYAKLAHLVSTVEAVTTPSTTLRDVLEATFPPGSVTGAPKERALEIIEALEPVSRGVYTGAVGYVTREGGASLAVAIRAAQAIGSALCYHAGGGIVEASVPAREVDETELKARVFLDAVDALARATPR